MRLSARPIGYDPEVGPLFAPLGGKRVGIGLPGGLSYGFSPPVLRMPDLEPEQPIPNPEPDELVAALNALRQARTTPLPEQEEPKLDKRAGRIAAVLGLLAAAAGLRNAAAATQNVFAGLTNVAAERARRANERRAAERAQAIENARFDVEAAKMLREARMADMDREERRMAADMDREAKRMAMEEGRRRTEAELGLRERAIRVQEDQARSVGERAAKASQDDLVEFFRKSAFNSSSPEEARVAIRALRDMAKADPNDPRVNFVLNPLNVNQLLRAAAERERRLKELAGARTLTSEASMLRAQATAARATGAGQSRSGGGGGRASGGRSRASGGGVRASADGLERQPAWYREAMRSYIAARARLESGALTPAQQAQQRAIIAGARAKLATINPNWEKKFQEVIKPKQPYSTAEEIARLFSVPAAPQTRQPAGKPASPPPTKAKTPAGGKYVPGVGVIRRKR